MMTTRPAVCMKCSHAFAVHEERSQRAHLLHCVRCGRDKRIVLSDLKDHYHRYIRTLLSPSPAGIQSGKEPVTPLFSDEHLDIRKYTYMVEHLAGSCVCGAVFRFSGKPRCPKCRSTVIRTEQGKTPGDPKIACFYRGP